jgi:DNA-binding transcriptional LysR family regulator
MNWDDLRIFVALSRAGSLSGAARALRTEHSTVARRIAGLESDLGLRLFERTARGYRLTAEGERIADQAYRLEEEALGIERVAAAGASELEGTVRISAPPVFAARFLTPRLARLRSAQPGILIELTGERLMANLTRRDADIAVRLSRPQGASAVARRIGRLDYGLYGAVGYAAGRPDPDWLGYDEAMDHAPQQKWLLGLAAGRPLAIRTNDLACLHEAAAAGLGLAALPRFLGDPDPRLERIEADASAAARELWLVVHPDLRRSPRVRVVMDWLAEVVEADRPLLAPPRG